MAGIVEFASRLFRYRVSTQRAGQKIFPKMPKPNFFTRHLREINETYFVHMFHALGFARDSLKSFGFFLTHSFFPFLFLTNGSDNLKRLLARIVLRGKFIEIAITKNKQVAIVGFGLSGLLSFFNLVKNFPTNGKKLKVVIFEKSHLSPKSVAYGTKNPNHLLNVPAIRMGIVSESRDDFFKWLCLKGYKYQETDFVPRQIFGIYLEEILDQALKIAQEKNIQVEFRKKEIGEIFCEKKRGEKTGRDYFVIDGDVFSDCVLAVGSEFKDQKKTFWQSDLEKYLDQKEIHILGCGLTAIDAAISLRDAKYLGKIFLHSRRGKLSQPHQISDFHKKGESPLSLEDADLPLSKIFHKFVVACKKEQNWRVAFDAFRPLTQRFWASLDAQKKRQFLRHCFRWWNIHRHRCPEVQFAAITQMIESGQLVVSREKIDSKNTLDCTGFGYGIESDLIKNLVKNRLAIFDQIHAGIISQNENFYIASSLNFGSLLEITAAPEIAPQARLIAQKILISAQ